MNTAPAPHFIGIDLAWKQGNPSGVAVIDADANLVEYAYCVAIDDIVEIVHRFPKAIVGVDAPLIIPNTGGHRPNERAFLKTFAKYGLGVHAANTQWFEKRFPRYAGYALFDALKALGFCFTHGNLFEVYPHATILALFNHGQVLRYKASVPRSKRLTALKQLQTGLFEVITVPDTMQQALEPLRGKALKAEEDFLDSLVCAYTLLHCVRNDCLCFGDVAVGKLLTPAM